MIFIGVSLVFVSMVKFATMPSTRSMLFRTVDIARAQKIHVGYIIRILNRELTHGTGIGWQRTQGRIALDNLGVTQVANLAGHGSF